MKNTMGYIGDKAAKLLLLIAVIAPFVAWYYLAYQSHIFFGAATFTNVDLYFKLPFDMLLPTVFLSALMLFPLFSRFKSSAHNTLRLERFFARACHRAQPGHYPAWVFYLALTVLYGFGMYLFMDVVVSMANGAQLHMQVNLLTMEPNGTGDHHLATRLLQSVALLGLMIATLIFKPKGSGGAFLLGFFVIPLFFDAASGVKHFLNGSSEAAAQLEGAMSSLLTLGYAFDIGSGIFAAILVALAIVVGLSEKLPMKKQVAITASGFMCSFLAAVVALYLFYKGPSIEAFTNNPNIMTVEVHGAEYTIDQSLLSEMDDRDTESLIESYVGLSMHNATHLLEELALGVHNVDVEMAVRFSADVTLQNLRKYADKSDAVVAYMNTQTMDSNTAMPVLIQFIIFEASPLHHQERALVAIIEGRYQEAVDFYVQDALNRTIVETLPVDLKDEEHQTRTATFGHSVLQSIIYTLISKGYAELDYQEIMPESRERFKEMMAQHSKRTPDNISNERIEEWFRMFKTARLFNAEVTGK